MNGVQTRFKCKLDVKRCKRFVFPPSSLLPRSNALKTKAIRYFQTDRTLTRIVSPPLHTFSFADYYNPRRIHFGALRVLNDDTVAPGEGFGMHPHKNMEVVSIPLQGYLRHGDNVQNESTITPGEIQVMSTGTGIYHSEYNASKTEDLKFLQIWVIPNVEETKPEYHNYNIRPLLKRNELATFISPSGNTPAHLLQDTWFSIGTFDAGHSVIYRMHKPRTGVYIFVIEGEINVAGENLSRRDGIGIWDIESVTIEATSETQILAIEVAM